MRVVVAAVAAAATLALAPGRAAAQGGGGRHAAIILDLPASARALALGDAYSAVGGDDGAIFFNPAELATLQAVAASGSVQRYLASSTLIALAGAVPLSRGVLAVGVQSLDYGSEPEIVPDSSFGGQRGTTTGRTISAGDLAVSVGFARRVRAVRVGLALKGVREWILDAADNAAALDAGVAIDGPWGSTLGAALQNFGGSITLAGSSATLPRRARVGVAIPARVLGAFDVLGTAEVAHLFDVGTSVGGGLEVAWRPRGPIALVGRIGARTRDTGSAADAVTFGGGLRASHLAIDYAYEGFGSVGSATHRIGVRWSR